ncbi:MAG: YqgE/AlgH family protein [Nitrospirota bacterium]
MENKIGKGTLLIAMPMLNDPHFCQSVVLICNEGPDGVLGIILNRPTEVPIATLIHDFPNLSEIERIYEGGPIAQNGMLVLCRGANNEQQDIIHNVSLASNLEALQQSDSNPFSSEIRCYLGYAGWKPGQLEAEIKTGAWETLPANATLIFDADSGLLWPQLIRRLGKQWAFYATMPANPSLN